ncbi:MAG: winged helix DNA-binding protein, partial [Lactobacillus crispatus]|nr:winged helix DNA-binding protein [Lactobacillus crispatus]
EAFREAIANALVHRTWNINAQIKVSMFDNRIEVVSPGGLPHNLSKDEYLSGQISILRNPIVANVFFRLGLIEQFGTGIKRIKDSYQGSLVQPQFEIFENSIKIILPILKFITDDLSDDEKKVFRTIREGANTSTQISRASNFGKTKVLNLLKQLTKQGYVERIGEGRSTKYVLNK